MRPSSTACVRCGQGRTCRGPCRCWTTSGSHVWKTNDSGETWTWMTDETVARYPRQNRDGDRREGQLRDLGHSVFKGGKQHFGNDSHTLDCRAGLRGCDSGQERATVSSPFFVPKSVYGAPKLI